jgi:hypothetical protein
MSLATKIGSRFRKLAATLISLSILFGTAPRAPGAPGPETLPYRIAGQYVEICTCPKVCDCALLGRSPCAFVAALKIDAGQRADVPLGGLALAIVAAAPGARGPQEAAKPSAALYVDPRATPTQAEALTAIAHEKFAARVPGPFPSPKPAAMTVDRSTEVVSITVEGVASVRGKPLLGGFHRFVQIQNGPGMTFPVLFLARGAVGQVADPFTGVRFEAEGRSVLFGKFDVSNLPRKKS